MIAALVAAPLLIAFPALQANIRQPGFVVRNLDLVLIFFVLPLAAALWLACAGPRRRR